MVLDLSLRLRKNVDVQNAESPSVSRGWLQNMAPIDLSSVFINIHIVDIYRNVHETSQHWVVLVLSEHLWVSFLALSCLG